MTRSIVPALSLALLAACQTLPATETSMDSLPPCATVAAEMQAQIGQPIDGTQATGRAGRRILRPGDAATMDFVPERLNLVTDSRGRLTRAYCG